MDDTPRSKKFFINNIVGLITLALVFGAIIKSILDHRSSMNLLQLQSTEAIEREKYERFRGWISMLGSESRPEVAAAIAAISDLALKNDEFRRPGRGALFENLRKSGLESFEDCVSAIDSFGQHSIARGFGAQESFIALLKLDASLNEKTNLQDFKICGIILNNFQLNNVKIYDSELIKLRMEHVDAKNISFRKSHLQGIILSEESNFNEADFSDTNMEGATISDTSISNAQFFNTDLSGCKFDRLKVREASFYNTKVDNGALNETEFKKTSFDNSNWINSTFSGIKFINTSLCGMNILHSELRNIEILENSVGRGLQFINIQAWNLNIDSNVDMSRAGFSGDFEHLNMVGVYLRDSIFNNANINGAVLKGSDLRRSHFINQCTLKRVNLEDANLTDVVFGDTDLSHARFAGADLRGADLSNTLNLQDALLVGSFMDRRTIIPDGFDPKKYGINIR